MARTKSIGARLRGITFALALFFVTTVSSVQADTVLITGANRGIGLELCRQLKGRGRDVIAVCRKGSTALDELGVRTLHGVDVTDSILDLAHAIEDRYGQPRCERFQPERTSVVDHYL